MCEVEANGPLFLPSGPADGRTSGEHQRSRAGTAREAWFACTSMASRPGPSGGLGRRPGDLPRRALPGQVGRHRRSPGDPLDVGTLLVAGAHATVGLHDPAVPDL